MSHDRGLDFAQSSESESQTRNMWTPIEFSYFLFYTDEILEG